MVRRLLILGIVLYILPGCGDRDASISLNDASKSYTIQLDEAKKLQMVIVGDPTASMTKSKQELARSFPVFAKELIDSGFVFEIFCSTTSYIGDKGTIFPIQNKDLNTLSQLIGNCINATSNDDADERGLEAAKLTWEKVMESNQLDPTAVKLTMIVTNEDDCSRDLNEHPIRDEKGNHNGCKDQNTNSNPIILEDGYTSDSRLFPISRYTDFFNKNLKYETIGKVDKVDKVLRERGHIFAPVVLRPPADAGSAEARACIDQTLEGLANKSTSEKIRAYGMRYFQVAKESNNKTYSLCENVTNVLSDINIEVQKQVEQKRFILDRIPKDPSSLVISIKRKISAAEKAKTTLDIMDKENKKSSADSQWSMTSEKKKTIKNIEFTEQIWIKKLLANEGFSYDSNTNEIILNSNFYNPYNDILTVDAYEPAKLDGEVDYNKK